MADAPPSTQAPEPSMEEILASIRRIISDDKDASPPAEEPLELTQELQADGSVVDIGETQPASSPAEVKAEPVVQPAAPAVAAAEPAPVFAAAPGPTLVSEQTAAEAASSLHTLASTVEIEELATAPRGMSYLGNGARTLEDMVLELMQPLLRQWLDKNLSPIVDRLVQKEIERISRRSKD